MAIKNKDGSTYRISGPNPLMNKQDFWKDFITHNFDWVSEIAKDETHKILKNYEFDKIKKNENIEDKTETIEDKTEIESKIEIKEQEPKIEEIKNNIKKYNSILSFCLPAKNTEKKDNVYDESYTKTDYMDKFLVDIVILEQEDFFIKIWCDKLLTKKSIIYPKNKDKRWWKISEVESAPVGYYYLANISDYTPSFE